MPLEFTKVTHDNPCPLCNRGDWCEYGSRAMHCMRVESSHPAKDGGWYHFYDKTLYRPPVREFKPLKQPSINAYALWERWFDATTNLQYAECAKDLGVTAQSLANLGACYAPEYRAWAFPMFDGWNSSSAANGKKMIGIRLRNKEGFKWTVKGSRNGIFLPPLDYDEEIAFIPEGPTDCAALLTLGFYPIGRPNDQSCFEMVKSACFCSGVRKVVIVSDNDELKQYGNAEARPGLRAANKLKDELGLPSTIWMPYSPLKDVRQFLQQGGTREMILNDLKQRIFTR